MKDEKEPGLLQILAAIRHRELYLNVPIHLFILIPAATFLAFMGRRLDRILHWRPYLSPPVSVVLACIMFATGIFIVWYSYGYLYIKGKGSPGSHVDGGTRQMVTTGIFSVIRHPSVVGKLIGVLGLGVLFASPSFTVFIIPVLLLYSILTNRFLQEKYCEDKFGDEYREYRCRTPMLIPRAGALMAWLRGGR
ncbi:isoprenylcysteine carboxylmethyltransferase family protein [bacterium]|nr:isoprenylcysteine carboxylmethyltransferase family protein [candidate division CSSED10-310 bacterium]